jgi:acetyltransferase-like isoleucine patch superfamily enzyme
MPRITSYARALGLGLKLRFHGVQVGRRVHGNTCRIINNGSIELGDSVSVNSFPGGEPYRVCLYAYFPTSRIRIGHRCNLNGTVIYCRKSVTVGDYCMFGPGVVILDNNSHNTSIDPQERRTGEIKEAPVVLHDNVWVGMRSIIMKGVTIGDNSIITPNSVVVRDVEPNSVYGGNPATFIKALS